MVVDAVFREMGVDDRELDIVVWGATGFTGRLVAEHLLRRYGADGDLRWALGGRNGAKLEDVRRFLGATARTLPLVVADADDRASLDALASRVRVVCSTVGPYALYGSKLVAACAGAGTHYCDLTGEVPWMRRMIEAHHDRARATGARIVHTCGFDSVPSDLGTMCVQQAAMRRYGEPCRTVRFRLREARGSFSGGTVASMLNMLEEAAADPGIQSVLADPYALNPADERGGLDGPERTLPWYEADLGAWITPFVMAVINTKVVRRSNALAGFPYGRDFRYGEGMAMPFGPWGFPLAVGLSSGSAAVSAITRVTALRRALAPMLPQPGQGPSARERERGGYRIELIGEDAGPERGTVKVVIRGDADPGYGSTSKMLGEAAACLALDPLGSGGGVQTPAVAMGDALQARLGEYAGVTFEVVAA